MKKSILLFFSSFFLFNLNFHLYAQDSQTYVITEKSTDDIESQNKVYKNFQDETTGKYGIKDIVKNDIVIEADFDYVWIYFDKYFVLKKDQKFAFTKPSSLKQPFNFQTYTDWHFPQQTGNSEKPIIILTLGNKREILDENLNPILPVEYDYNSGGLSNEAIVAKNQKLGVYNFNLGKLVVPVIYDEIRVIGNSYMVSKAGKSGLLNKKYVLDIDLSEYKTSNFYRIGGNDFLCFRKDSLYGLINTETRKILLPEKYTKIDNWGAPNGKWIFQVRANQHYGLLNQEFKEILPPIYSEMYSQNYNKASGDLTIYKNLSHSHGLFNVKLEKIVIPTVYKDVSVYSTDLPPSEWFFKITNQDNTYSVLDTKYNSISNDNYTEVNFHTTYTPYAKKYQSYIHLVKNEKHGVYLIKNISKSFPVKYDSFEGLGFTGGFILGDRQKKVFYNDEGQILLDNLKTTKYLGVVMDLKRLSRLPILFEGSQMVVKNLENKAALLGTYTYEMQLPFEYDDITLRYFDNYITKKNEKFGLIDLRGNVKVPFEYDTLYCSKPYQKYTHILGKQKGLCGMIDSTNKIIIPFQYENIEPINIFFKAKINGKYFIFNSKGTKISDQGFDDVGMFLNWKCRVVINNEHKYISGEGKILTEEKIKTPPIDGFKTLEDLVQNFILILNTDDDNKILDFCKKITADEYSCEYLSKNGYDYTWYFERRVNIPYEDRVEQFYLRIKEIIKNINKEELTGLSIDNEHIRNIPLNFSPERENIDRVRNENIQVKSNTKMCYLHFDWMLHVDGYWKVFPFISFYSK